MEEQLKIIYLHGFNSSAESKKSKILESFLKGEELISFESPNLDTSPSEAISQIEKKFVEKLRTVNKMTTVLDTKRLED